QRSSLIRDNFSSIRQLKAKQKALATELGGALKFAVSQKETINGDLEVKRQQLTALEKEFALKEDQHKEGNQETMQEIGALRSKLKEAGKRRKACEDRRIAGLLREAEDRPRLVLALQARENESGTLTAGFSDIE